MSIPLIFFLIFFQLQFKLVGIILDEILAATFPFSMEELGGSPKIPNPKIPLKAGVDLLVTFPPIL